ncbi:unnamed protein product [Brassica napus]|nr:unnamed protein product [Brassica napus]VDD30189.1 unnamed protein product [Brassica oleracea]
MASSRVVFSDLKSSPQNRKNKFYQIQTVKRLHNEWIENTYRWVTGFLEIFEEGFIRRGLQSEGVFKRGESENSQKQTGEWKGSEKSIVHDNDDAVSRENHKVLKNKIEGQPLFICHG